MEVELAAVKGDVERKRVGKNPFDENFTALVRISYDTTKHISLHRLDMLLDNMRPPLLPFRQMPVTLTHFSFDVIPFHIAHAAAVYSLATVDAANTG